MNKLSFRHKFLIVFLIIIFLVNVIFKIFNIDLIPKSNSTRFGYADFDIEGVVIRKFLNKKHNYPTISIKIKDTVRDFLLVHDKNNLFEFIKISDSVFKDSGDFNVRIKRDAIDTTLTWRSSVNELWYNE